MKDKGRNTTCITIRLEDVIVKALQERALKVGLKTPGEYVKAQILKGLHSDITTTNINSNPSAITTGSPKEFEHYIIKRVNGELVKQETDLDGNIIYE